MKKVKLGEVCDILSGYAFKSSQFNDKKIGLPLIRIRDVERGFSDTYFEGTYPEEYLIKNGDLLITMDGSFILKKWEGDLALLNQRVCKIKITDKSVDEGYISWLIPKFLKEIEDKTPFVTVKHLSVAKIKDISFVLPNKLEQKLISKKLNTISQIYDFRKIQSEGLNELVKSRFNEMFGDPILNDMEWEVTKLGKLTNKISSGNTPKGGSQVYVDKGIMFFRSQNVWKNKILLDDIAYIDDQTNRNMKDTILEHGDLLITKTGRVNTENSSLGRTAQYLGQSGKANINGHVYLVRINSDISKRFILEILISNAYRDYIRRICVGGIDKRQLNKNHIEDFPIILPPLSLQNEFVDFVAQVDKSQLAIQKSLEELETLKKSLMQEYFG